MEITDLGFEEVCRKLEEYAGASDSDPVITLPEILGKVRDELLVSAWLMHLLNPKRNGFGVAPLRAMLGEVHPIAEDEEIEIEREYTFKDGRRIDIFISTGDFLIGIEIKLQSGELQNQTRDYWKSIQKTIRDCRENAGLHLSRTDEAEGRSLHAHELRGLVQSVQGDSQ